jgi:hypothetical protein
LWIDFEILKVKVPVIFSGTQCFPVRSDGRYTVTSIPQSTVFLFGFLRLKFIMTSAGCIYHLLNVITGDSFDMLNEICSRL